MAACQRGVPVSVGAAVCLFAQLFLCAPGTADVWTAGQGGTAWDRLVLARESRNVEVDPEGQLQPRRVSEEQNLCLGVYDRGGWYTGVGSNLIWSGTINGAFDGNVNTAAIINAGRGRISVDLGAAYPVTRVRFYPRPSFPLRFIPGFALFANDGQSPPDLSGMDMWTLGEVTIQGTSTCRIDWQPLLERRENLDFDRFGRVQGHDTVEEILVEALNPTDHEVPLEIVEDLPSTWEIKLQPAPDTSWTDRAVLRLMLAPGERAVHQYLVIKHSGTRVPK